MVEREKPMIDWKDLLPKWSSIVVWIVLLIIRDVFAELPVILIPSVFPEPTLTSNFLPGFVVPIPTLPSASIRTFSVPLGLNTMCPLAEFPV